MQNTGTQNYNLCWFPHTRNPQNLYGPFPRIIPHHPKHTCNLKPATAFLGTHDVLSLLSDFNNLPLSSLHLDPSGCLTQRGSPILNFLLSQNCSLGCLALPQNLCPQSPAYTSLLSPRITTHKSLCFLLYIYTLETNSYAKLNLCSSPKKPTLLKPCLLAILILQFSRPWTSRLFICHNHC